MANEISTAGAIVSYAFEAVEGVRPLTGYQRIPGIKATPDLNPEPSSLEVTDLSDQEWKRYIPGMKDPGGAIGFEANNTNELQGAWRALCHFADEAMVDDLATWFCIDIPGLNKAFYFAGSPSALGVIGMEVDSVAEVTAYISPNRVDSWQDKPLEYAAYITPLIRLDIPSGENEIERKFVIDPVDANIESAVSAEGHVSVTIGQDNNLIFERVSTGTDTIFIETDDGDGYTIGKTLFEIETH